MVLSELCALRGVSGDEGEVRAYIVERARAAGASVQIDRIGNVIAHKRGAAEGGRHILFAAHMDEIGLIVRGIEDTGLLCYQPVGGIDPRVMVSKRVRIGPGGVPGVIGAKAIHLQTPEDREKPLSHDQLFIDIGAADRQDAEKWVSPGDYVCPESDYLPFGDGFVRAKALDDRAGCYNLLRLLEGECPNAVSCAFTVQEEIGTHGAKVVAQRVRPDCAIVLEATAVNDLGDVEEQFRVAVPGRGVALSFMDNASIAHEGLFRALRDLADARGIPWQIKAAVSGGNDAGRLQTAGGAARTCVLSVPTRYIHSHSSVCALRDIEAQYELARAFAESTEWRIEP